MSAFETLIYEKEGAIAHLSLNRPQALNAFNVQMRDDFSEALAAAGEDPDVRALLVTGQGRAFCAGADLTEFGSAPSQAIARQVRWERDLWGQWRNLPKPVVAAAHGYCIGSGLEMVLLSDLRIAAASTVFAMPEVHLGMIPAAGGTQTLPFNAGDAAGLDLLFTGRRFDAAEALRLKLITRTCPVEELLGQAWSITEQLAALDPVTLSAVRTAQRRGSELPLSSALQTETRLAALALAGPAAPPDFRGNDT